VLGEALAGLMTGQSVALDEDVMRAIAPGRFRR
jgi:hypothetical protein